jgi:sugar phosphate isomerase/epimerase
VKIGGAHLTYCTNIHPGERWYEIRANLERYLPEVKRRVSPHAPFGVGLRLSAVAAQALSEPGELAAFEAFLAGHGLYVFTVNGFPYGPFHGTRVKEEVYLPDWRDPARLDYTNRLADLLARLMPPGLDTPASISTVPGAFKPAAASGEAVARIVEHVLRHAAHLVELERATGRRIMLALEPEPCCLLETVAETVAFFRTHLHGEAAAARLAALAGLDTAAAEHALRRHLGVCLDLCHAAVEFEDPQACIALLEGAGITIGKVQVTAGLRIPSVSAPLVESLGRYDDQVYLHQVVERSASGVARYPDLGEAVAAGRWQRAASEWRVHFHVPVFLGKLDPFESTQAFVREALARQRQRPCTTQLEVETYTWNVLPAQHRASSVEEAIARELEWVRSELA